jgi:hypothetical protein
MDVSRALEPAAGILSRASRRLWLVVAAAALAGCAMAGDQLAPSAALTTLTPDWPFRFAIGFQAEPVTHDTVLLHGRVESHYGQFATAVRLLGQALDSSNAVVGQRLAWLPSGIPGFGNTYFEIGPLAAADQYRVSIWSYTLVEDRGNLDQ